MCTFVASQHHSCRATQVSERLCIRNLNWSFGVGICTDGVAAMTGQLSGFTTLVKEAVSECESMHCVIHREMLAGRKMSSKVTFCRMWLKLSTTLIYMPLTHVCSRSSVRRWTQSTHVFPYAQKWEGFLKGDNWPEFLSFERLSRHLF